MHSAGRKNSGIWRFGGDSIIEECTTAHYYAPQNDIRFEWLEQEDDIMKVGFIGLGYGSGNVSQPN
jgi:hypothetical protein